MHAQASMAVEGERGLHLVAVDRTVDHNAKEEPDSCEDPGRRREGWACAR